MPEISVVIPTFNRADMLRKAVASALAQRGVDIEVLVSDNASTDHTPQVLAEFAGDARLVVSRNASNLGMVGNWRKAIFELARADWFVLMSDDDYFIDADYLATAAQAIRSQSPKFVYGGAYVDDVPQGTRSELRLPFNGLVPGAEVFASRGTVQPQDITLCNMVFRRQDAQRLGFLDDPDNLSCDSAFYLRLCCEGPVAAIAHPVSVYVKHGDNLSARINRDHRLLDHNLDYLALPYAHAIAQGMDAALLARFRHNTRLDAHLAKTLLRLRLHNEAWYQACRSRLQCLLPQLLAEVEASWGYRWQALKYSLAAARYRRRYPLA